MAVPWWCHSLRNFYQIALKSNKACITEATGALICKSHFHVQSIARFRVSTTFAQKSKKISYEDLPQPELKPVGPQDYERWKFFLNRRKTLKDEEIRESSKGITETIFDNVNQQIERANYGRLFAVVHIAGKQFKVTPEDIIVVQGYFPPSTGDVIRLEKVLMVGCSDFTLIGRPLLSQDSVYVEATVIEKTFSQIITHFVLRRRQNHRRTRFYRTPHTLLRINTIDFKRLVNEKSSVEGLENRIIS